MALVRSSISSNIESQFPGLYREEAELLVKFTEVYYDFVEDTQESFRNAFAIRDVDTTYERFLDFFKNKYLAGLPNSTELDTRFIIKHIQDLYSRKGSQESIELLFRMFFNEEVEIVYPSSFILKPSDSIYESSRYLELKPIKSIVNYPLKRGDRIYGNVSTATAFVNEVVFYNLKGVIVPVAYISNVRGNFVADDGVTITRGSSELFPGKIIHGSINSIEILEGGRSPGFQAGNILELRSSISGQYAQGLVEKVSEAATGTIDFKISDGGFGYVDDETNENVIITISNQTLIISEEGTVPKEGDILTANNQSVTALFATDTTDYSSFTITGEAVVMEQEGTLLYVHTDENNSFNVMPVNTKVALSINGDPANTVIATLIAPFNDSAHFEIGSLDNTETVKLITDVVGDFIDVPLSSSNYGMSGSGAENINTTIRDAFEIKDYVIGEISSLKITNSGGDYVNDVKVVVTQEDIKKFGKNDIGIIFSNPNFFIQRGDVVTQEIEIEDLTYQNLTVPYISRAEFLRREGNVFFFRPKTFYGFDRSLPITIKNQEYEITQLFEDGNSRAMGENAVILGPSIFEPGLVEQVKVLDSGYRYRDGEEIEMFNLEGKKAGNAIISVQGTGITAGKWKTTTSFLNESTKVIRDNFYYQEYSYEINSIVNPDVYNNIVEDIVKVAGTKQFGSYLINTTNTLNNDIDMSMEIYTVIESDLIANTQSGEEILVTESDDNIIAVIYNLDEDATESVNIDIQS